MDQGKENKEDIDLSSDSGVKFKDEWCRPAQTFYPGTPKIIQWVIKYSGGYVKDEKQANYVLVGFVAVAIIVSLFLVFSGGNKNTESTPEPFINKPQLLLK